MPLLEACSQCMTYEFQPENVSPFYSDYKVFVTPQWPCLSQLFFTCYRTAVSILMVVWLAVDLIDEGAKFYSDNFGVWFIFATNWSFLILATSEICRCVAAVHYHFWTRRRDQPESEESMIAYMLLWILYNIAANGALVVTMSYMCFLAALDTRGFLHTNMSVMKHTLNSGYILTDLFICAIPIRIYHLVYPLCLGAIYSVFNALYFINDGLGPDGKPYAYYIMDWRKPARSFTACSVGFVLSAILQTVLYLVYKLRILIFNKYCFKHSRNTDTSTSDNSVEMGEENCDINSNKNTIRVIQLKEIQRPQKVGNTEEEEMESVLLTLENVGLIGYNSTRNENIKMIDEE